MPDPLRFRRPRSTQFGNQLDVPGVQAAPGQPWEPYRKSLLDGNVNELWEEGFADPGAWVLTVTSTVRQPPSGAPGQGIVPLLCKVSLGSGGVSHALEVDAFPGFTLQVPTAAVRVEVMWDQVPFSDHLAAGYGLKIPALTRVRGTIQRGNLATDAYRSWVLDREGTVGGPGLRNTFGNVPAFAKSVGVYASRGFAGAAHNVFIAGSYLCLREVTGAFTTDLDGVELAAAIPAGHQFPVPAQSTDWQVLVSAAENNIARVAFRIQL